MKLNVVLLLCFYVSTVLGQKTINYELPVSGTIQLAEAISIPKVNRGYTLWLPPTKAIKGLVVFTHPRRDTTKSDFMIDYSLKNHLAVLYATTENRLEFFFDEDKLIEIEQYIQEVISNYNIPKDKLLYCGMSLEGTRALKLAIFGQSQASKYQLKPKAIAICDAPLNMVRFHKEMVKAKQLNIIPVTGSEGTWVSACLEKNLGGTPKEAMSAYVNYSPYCYAADGGAHLDLLKDIAIRAYNEPDVNWWIDTRRKDYYAMNSVDLAALINELKIKGSTTAELIITHDKGYYDDGTRHPHNWNIVDEKDLIDWFVKLIR